MRVRQFRQGRGTIKFPMRDLVGPAGFDQRSAVPRQAAHGLMELYAQFRMSSREQKWLRSARLLAVPYEATARQRIANAL
jgi:hypothetical protein